MKAERDRRMKAERNCRMERYADKENACILDIPIQSVVCSVFDR
jgi:hypothetical protein